MPKYAMRKKPKPTQEQRTEGIYGRDRRKYKKRLPKDPSKLLRWAGSGTIEDFDRLHKLARKARATVPTYLEGAIERISTIDKLGLIEEIQASEQHNIGAGMVLDGINYILDMVPFGSWLWPVAAAQSSINAMKGDGLNQVDEQFARLVGATYGTIEDRPYVLDHWRRQVQFDGEYISVFDNPDGHRVICVRGTQGAGDIGEDVLVGITGRNTNVIGEELLQILAATPKEVVVDLAAHSLGTSLALQAYVSNSFVHDAIHETYLYNPAYSPIMRGNAEKFERDTSVRYFINLTDAVSLGSIGHRAPSNVVYRTEGGPLTGHQLAQWQGSGVHTPQYNSPPVAELHAQKAVYGSGPTQKDPLSQLSDPEYLLAHVSLQDEQPVEKDTGAAEQSADAGAFDFGDVEQYDYAKL